MNFQLEDVQAFKTIFGSLAYDPMATRSIHLMAGAFVWSDEKPNMHSEDSFPVPIGRFFLALVSYRNTLMRNAPHEPFAPYWQAFQTHCPNWPGFRSERRDPQLIALLDRELDAELEKLERMQEICQTRRQRAAKDHPEQSTSEE